MKITYNAPVSLTFSVLALGALVLGILTDGASTATFFALQPSMDMRDPFSWLRLFTHPLGHGGWEHLFGNLSFILLLGPILEEKHSSMSVFWMMLITTLVTSVLNLLLFNTGLMGASGIVFMCILLASFTNINSGEIPLTFIAIVVLYLFREVFNAFREDDVSQFAHIIGGACGSIFGFLLHNTRKESRHA